MLMFYEINVKKFNYLLIISLYLIGIILSSAKAVILLTSIFKRDLHT